MLEYMIFYKIIRFIDNKMYCMKSHCKKFMERVFNTGWHQSNSYTILAVHPQSIARFQTHHFISIKNLIIGKGIFN